MGDQLIRAIAWDGKVRAFAARTTELVEEMRRRHHASPTAIAALGRTATAGVMMGAMLKGKEKLTIQIKGGGPLGSIVVDANAEGQVRGYVDHPGVDLPLNNAGKLDVAGAVGTDGYLYVLKDLGLKEPYRGSIPLVSGEIAEDITHYFFKSEQTPSAVALGVLVDVDYTVKAAGGFIIQLMPGCTDEEITGLEQRLSETPPVSRMLEEGMDLDEILASLLGMVQILDRMDLEFKCNCSREKIRQMLISLGKDELDQMIAEDGRAEVICHFCNEVYEIGEDELKALVQNM